MTAEQAWDSMMVLAHGSDIDKKKGGDGSFYKKILNIDFSEAEKMAKKRYQSYVRQTKMDWSEE